MSPKIVLFVFLPAVAAAADWNSLIEAARKAPPEFSADALIRVAEVESLPKPQRLELLGEAFEAAKHAQNPFRRHSALARQDGPVRFLNRTYDLYLDSLSLKLRAVEAALPLDASKAREWFGRIQPPAAPALKCDDFLIYDVSRFYETLGRILQSFPEQEKSSGAPFRLLRTYVGAVTSPVEIAPLTHVLTSAPVGDEDFVALLAIFNTALGKITGDDRSFTASRMVGPEIQALVAECKRRKISPLPLIESYRLYLVVNLSAPRCGDDDQLAGGGGVSFALASGIALDPLASDFIRFFNDNLRAAPLQRIGEEESTPARLEGAVTGLRTCQDEECQSISKLARDLVASPEGTPYSPAARNTGEWRKKFDAVLEAAAKWKDSQRETPVEQFREKADLYGLLLNLAPDAETRDRAVHGEIEFLAENPVAKTDRAEWFLPVQALLGRIVLDPGSFGKFGDELRNSTDPVIALYARLEQAAPRRPDQILPLL